MSAVALFALLSLTPLTPEALPAARAVCYRAALPEWDSGVTHRVIQANTRYTECLLNLGERLLLTNYDPAAFAPHTPRQYLQQVTQQVQDLAAILETQPRSCAPMCGTLWQMTASGAGAQFLEQLLRNTAERLFQEQESGESSPTWKKCWDSPESCK
jgi:hypothetical protein